MISSDGISSRRSTKFLTLTFGLAIGSAGCSADYSESFDDANDIGAAVEDGAPNADGTPVGDDNAEIGTSHQAWFSNPFNFTTSCSDSKGTNSVMAALAVAAGTEIHRWQPTKDFASSSGFLKLTTTGKAQCADGKCWNTQAILDLQSAPAGRVEIRPGVLLDPSALKSALTTNLALQLFSLSSLLVPDHRLELIYSEPGGCDQYFWFNVKNLSGGSISSLLASTLEKKLKWVGGDGNPYVQFQSTGTMVGVDPTYGLNESSSTAAGSCTAACTKMSSADVTGACCSCNGTKKYSRSVWSATTYICM